jgi:hypothetical protein
MRDRLAAILECHPILGWVMSAFSVVSGFASWFVAHVDGVSKIVALSAVMFGSVAGYYTMRIQRRTWQRDGHRRRSKDSFPPNLS